MSDPSSPAPHGAKRYLAGTHRIMDPDATLASLLPRARLMGITRLAVLTGLEGDQRLDPGSDNFWMDDCIQRAIEKSSRP
jgi:hypothetical protein